MESTCKLSQGCLKKSETLTNSLTLCILKDKITDPELLNARQRRIKQENKIVNKFFITISDEMLNSFCENNTQLTWADVEVNLLLYINSRMEVPGTETDKLIPASDTIQKNMNTILSFQCHLEKLEKLSKRCLLCIWKAKQNHYL